MIIYELMFIPIHLTIETIPQQLFKSLSDHKKEEDKTKQIN